MKKDIINDARRVLTGKSGRLDDEELEYLAQEITKLGFKLGFARAYAVGPSLIEKLILELERKNNQLSQIRLTLGCLQK